MKLSEITSAIGGELDGNDVDIMGVSGLDEQSENTIAYAENKRNLGILIHSNVAAVIIKKDMTTSGKPVVKVDDPKFAFSKVLELFSPYKAYKKEIYPNTYIETSAKIGKNVTVLPFSNIMDQAEIGDDTVIYSQVFIGKNVKLGRNCIIKAGVKIDDETTIGDRVIIHHNSVIGGDGFGYIQKDGKNIKVPQIGKIVIEDDVEIGSCVTIDRSTIGNTVICKGVKVDNLVQIAHNVKIGENSFIVAQVGIAGSSTLGRDCFLAGQVGISDHVTIGDNVAILAQAGIESKKVIESNKILWGSPARDVIGQKRIIISLDKLPELVKTITAIKKKLDME
jgi:UDP-3-O-[3-hydroxymyristoyl] glucosamine N-acyltransferase